MRTILLTNFPFAKSSVQNRLNSVWNVVMNIVILQRYSFERSSRIDFLFAKGNVQNCLDKYSWFHILVRLTRGLKVYLLLGRKGQMHGDLIRACEEKIDYQKSFVYCNDIHKNVSTIAILTINYRFRIFDVFRYAKLRQKCGNDSSDYTLDFTKRKSITKNHSHEWIIL